MLYVMFTASKLSSSQLPTASAGEVSGEDTLLGLSAEGSLGLRSKLAPALAAAIRALRAAISASVASRRGPCEAVLM